MPTDLFDEWATGTSLASAPTDNTFFQEITGDLENPQNFSVDPEQIPDNPMDKPEVSTVENPVVSEVEDTSPEVIELSNGGRITIEKTNKGWKAILDSGDANAPEENFYGNNWRNLLANLAKAKLEATKAIRKLKKEKMLGGDEPQHVPVKPKNVEAKVSTLTADQIVGLKNMLADNPGEAFDTYIKNKFNLDPDDFAEALRAAPKAQQIAEMQRIQAEVKDVNDDFIRNNPDFVEKYQSDENARLLIQRLAKVYLKKSVSKSLKVNVDDVIYDLFKEGFWTEENLETAKDELIESGLLEPITSTTPTQTPTRQPVANSPSDPPKRIATGNTGTPAGLGLPARNSSPTVVPEEKPLTVSDLHSLSQEQLRQIAMAQLKSMR